MASSVSATSSRRAREPYAPVPRRVVESAAYQALPDWAVRVLLAIACQYNGRNNGALCLTDSNHKRLGVRALWHVHGGVRLLQEVGLIVRTRSALVAPDGIARYALTWRAIDQSDANYVDARARRKPANTWCEWERPNGWNEYVGSLKRTVKDTDLALRARGDGFPFKSVHGDCEIPLSAT